MVNDLIFGGVKSSDYGIHISGEGVFNAPERDTEVITIPGRSGSFLLDRGRFENIEVTYPAYCYCDTYEKFAETVAAYRNAIASQVGYQRLEDTIHPDEYRMGAFISGLEVDPIMYNSGATFDITFECKPQRYLTSGEEKKVLGTWGDTETKTGEIVELENDGSLAVKSAEVALEPQQDTSGGVPSPSHICPITGASDVDVNVADDYDDPQTLNTYTTSLGTTVYGGSVDVVGGTGTVTYGSVDLGSLNWTYAASGLFYPNSNLPMKAPTSAAERKTGIICSIYAPSTVVALDGSQDDKSILRYGQRVYIKDSAYTDAATFKTAMNGVQLVYELDTPTTLTLTPTQVDLISGTNYVFSPQGEITLEYGTNPNYIVNPTLFGCGPLIEAKGYGDIAFNGYTIKLANGAIGTVNLWQETRGGTFNGSITKTFVTGQFEPTDTFSFTVTHMFTLSEVNPSITNTNANAINSRDIGVGWEITYRIDLPCTFTVGTTGQITNTSTYDFGSGKKVISDMDVSYDSTTGTVVYTVATTTQGQPSFEGTKHGFSISDCNAVSTLNRLGDPTYIDCDLGEAYKINDGKPVGLNSFVDLGSKLPELVPGINEFTVSNTFTEVAVVPRWWRI